MRVLVALLAIASFGCAMGATYEKGPIPSSWQSQLLDTTYQLEANDATGRHVRVHCNRGIVADLAIALKYLTIITPAVEAFRKPAAQLSSTDTDLFDCKVVDPWKSVTP